MRAAKAVKTACGMIFIFMPISIHRTPPPVSIAIFKFFSGGSRSYATAIRVEQAHRAPGRTMVGSDVLGGPARPVRALRPVNTERAEARGHGDGFEAGLRAASSATSSAKRVLHARHPHAS